MCCTHGVTGNTAGMGRERILAGGMHYPEKPLGSLGADCSDRQVVSGIAFRVACGRYVGAQVLQPDLGACVARSTPVAARRERAAGADLRPVRHRRALELAGGEEASEEQL